MSFLDVCAHRMILRPQARVEGLDARDILKKFLKEVNLLWLIKMRINICCME